MCGLFAVIQSLPRKAKVIHFNWLIIDSNGIRSTYLAWTWKFETVQVYNVRPFFLKKKWFKPEMSLMASVMELFHHDNIEYQPESLYYDVSKCIGLLSPWFNKVLFQTSSHPALIFSFLLKILLDFTWYDPIDIYDMKNFLILLHTERFL